MRSLALEANEDANFGGRGGVEVVVCVFQYIINKYNDLREALT